MPGIKLTMLLAFVLVSTTSARLYFETHYIVRCSLPGIYDLKITTTERKIELGWPMRYEFNTEFYGTTNGTFVDYKTGWWHEWVGYVITFEVTVAHDCTDTKTHIPQYYFLNCTVFARDEDRVCAIHLDADLQTNVLE